VVVVVVLVVDEVMVMVMFGARVVEVVIEVRDGTLWVEFEVTFPVERVGRDDVDGRIEGLRIA